MLAGGFRYGFSWDLSAKGSHSLRIATVTTRPGQRKLFKLYNRKSSLSLPGASNAMAFSRMTLGGDEQAKSIFQVPLKVATGLCSIVITSTFDQTDQQIIHRSQNTPRSANRHAGRIFAESNIPAIVQAGFDKLIISPNLE